MSGKAQWLPELICLGDYGGVWPRYVEAVYAVFKRDFIDSQPILCGKSVQCRRELVDGKEAAFWHCTSEGPDEQQRVPDLRRCERIGWARAIIEHSRDASVQTWSVRKSRDKRTFLWCAEEYLIVLGQRKRTWQLITAFPTDRGHTVKKLRREAEKAKNS